METNKGNNLPQLHICFIQIYHLLKLPLSEPQTRVAIHTAYNLTIRISNIASQAHFTPNVFLHMTLLAIFKVATCLLQWYEKRCFSVMTYMSQSVCFVYLSVCHFLAWNIVIINLWKILENKTWPCPISQTLCGVILLSSEEALHAARLS